MRTPTRLLAIGLLALGALLLAGMWPLEIDPGDPVALAAGTRGSDRPVAIPEASDDESAPVAEPVAPESVSVGPAGGERTTAFEIRLDEFGEPQGGVEIVLVRGDFERRGKTDPHGVYRTELPEGEYRLEIPARGLVTAIRATGLANATVDLRIPGRATLEGRIVDAESLGPVAEAWVEVYPEGWGGESPAYHRMGWTQTDEAGRFRIEGLPERPVLVVATKRTHSPWREVVLAGEDRELRLVPLGGFRLLVLDAAGAPAGLTPVEVAIRGPSGFDETYEALSDDEGRIHVTDLASGPYRVRIRRDGGDWSDERNVFAAPGEGLPVEFRIQRNETDR